MNGTVISGDIINSQKLSKDKLTEIINRLNEWFETLVQSAQYQYYFFRGDGFQLYSPTSKRVFEVAIALRLIVRACGSDVRLSIAEGPIEQLKRPLATSTGWAFVHSGKGLDQMKPFALRYQKYGTELCPHFELNIQLIDHLVGETTVKQAKALYYYVSRQADDHYQLAELLGTSRVNATKLLNLGNYQFIERFLELSKETHLK
ncbi:hypothetical protein NI389_00005 [Pseudoalteromonas xiamenensis]|uniref:hypothetical protein n=1 Tax=Pseudoalteromonas xiamenensis TaxID=882626 RepID=UPI0027E3E2DD|nr:hypothetical protein [Pseudoalteromonas xiamenensis]WMN59855.1 hypothetical protein NI389_00005 [Pseudoalteromonas xiamenensis]